MTRSSRELRRLSEVGSRRVASLIRSAQSAPEKELPHLRWRVRASLRQRASRVQQQLRVLLVAGSVFLAGGMVGAVVGHHWGKPAGPPTKAERTAPAKPAPGPRHVAHVHAAVDVPAAVTPPVTSETKPLEAVAVPVATPRGPVRAARQGHVADLLPDPPPARAAPEGPAPPSPLVVEQALLGDILKSLRQQGDPRAALALLDDHGRRFPESVLAPEVAMLRAEALLALGRQAEALSVLDRLALAAMPNPDERLVLRGELRAAAGRWREARADFETALATGATSRLAGKSDATERALWGRASARSHLGDPAGARADLELYVRSFPAGRFAMQASALLQGTP